MSFKLLHIDIETSPLLAYTWRTRQQDISVDQIVVPTGLLSFAAKWEGRPKIMWYGRNEAGGINAVVQKAHELLSEADAVCHYNGKSFDIPRLNAEFLRLGLPPPPRIPQIDLKQTVMSQFDMTSSKLAFVGPYLRIGEKVKNEGWPLWIGCLAGDAASWRKMRTYNIGDVALLARLYNKLKGWIPDHPNLNLFNGTRTCCPNCGSYKMQQRGVRRTVTLSYVRFQCQNCGHWSQSRASIKTGPRVEVR